MRSQGQVRFIKISSRLQIAAVAILTTLLLAWLVTVAALTVVRFQAERDRIALAEREAKVVSAESRVSNYREDLDSVTADLAKRQDFIERMVDAHISELPEDLPESKTVAEDKEEARALLKISSVLPEAAPLYRIEMQQLAFVRQLTRYADRKTKEAEAVIRKLGLNPDAMLAAAARATAEGGPFLSLATSRDGSLDPRFKRLGLSLARMDALERGLASIPQVQPASTEFISSGFGYRTDPFNGKAAFHAGLDFRGPRGAPIFAAAKGIVSFAGIRHGYGNCVEIRHGNGLMTRYAHMSRIRSFVGERVQAGQVIGAIGSTGRSTGPHLHFEVRIHDRPVNPRPFLEAAPDVHEEADAGA